MKTIRLLAAGFLAAFAMAPQAADLGDPAAPLDIAEWVKGKPVNLADAKGKKILVVEFWATWCPPCRTSIPHLTELQKKYKDKDVIFVGVSDEKASVVKPFVNKMGDKMDYVVAIDKDRKTSDGYMRAYKQGGIPHAFIVDKEGRVVWQGHPMAQLDQALDEVIAGKLDLEKAKKRSQAGSLLQDYYQQVMRGTDETKTKQLEAQLEALDRELGGIQSGHSFADLKKQMAANRIVQEYMTEVTGDADDTRLADLGKQLGAIETDNAQMLNEIAWTLLTDDKVKKRDLPLASKLAKAAYDACEGKDAAIVDTYARALFDTGRVQEAVEYQKKAVKLCEDEAAREQLAKNLKQYEAKAAAGK